MDEDDGVDAGSPRETVFIEMVLLLYGKDEDSYYFIYIHCYYYTLGLVMQQMKYVNIFMN